MTEHAYDSWGSGSERFADGSLCIGIDLGTTNSCAWRRWWFTCGEWEHSVKELTSSS